MSNTSPCTPKRKRGEQSAEEPAVVRRSARQKAKGQESIIDRAMNRKKVNSLELNSSRASQTRQKGRGHIAEADSANIANELQQPPAATGDHVKRSGATLASTSNQVNSVGRNHISNESPAGLNPQVLEFQSACTVSRKDELPKVHSQGIRSSSETVTRRVSQSNIAGSNTTTIQASQLGSNVATIAGRRTAQTDSANIANELQPPPTATGDNINRSWATLSSTSNQVNSVSRNHVSNASPAGLNPQALEFQSACTVSSKDELPKVHSQGKLNASSSIFVPWTATGAHKLLPKKSHTQSSAVMCDKSKYNDCKTNSPKHHHPEKPVPSSLKHGSVNRESTSCIRSSSETATSRVSQSNIAGSNHTTIQASQSGSSIATIAGIRSASTNRVNQSQVAIQAAHAGSGSVAISDPFDPNIVALDSQRIHSPSIPTIPASPMVAPRGGVANPSFQMILPHFDQGKDAVSLRPPISIMHSRNAPVQGRRTSTNYGRRQFVPRRPNLVNHNPQRTHSPSSPTIPQFPTIAPRAANPSVQNIRPHSGPDKVTESSLPPSIPTTNALKVPAQGVRSSSSTAGCTTKPSPVQENEVLRKKDVAKNRSFNEKDVAKAPNLNKKSVTRSSKPMPIYYIKSEGSSQMSTGPPPLVPLGERCHLCGIDLAFAAKGSDSQNDDPPFAAVLPCSHSYHDHCITNIFGAGEPPCVRCLENEPPQGS